MFNKTKIALSVALVLGTASGAFAATKRHGHKASAVHAHVSAPAFSASASVNRNYERGAPGSVDDPPGSAFQDAGFRSELGYPPR